MRTSFFGFLGIALLLSFLPFFVFAATFSRDLSLGDSGKDVLELQRLLNEDERTQIAAFGPGSPGNETTYFGSLTADAVRRYQEAHASEILTPLGLFVGTGFFGQATRSHITMRAEEAGGVSYEIDDTPPGGFRQTAPLATIPRSEDELIEKYKEITGSSRANDENIREFTRVMLYASQGMEYSPQGASGQQSGDDDGGNDDDEGEDDNGGSGGGGGAGCMDILLDMLGL